MEAGDPAPDSGVDVEIDQRGPNIRSRESQLSVLRPWCRTSPQRYELADLLVDAMISVVACLMRSEFQRLQVLLGEDRLRWHMVVVDLVVLSEVLTAGIAEGKIADSPELLLCFDDKHGRADEHERKTTVKTAAPARRLYLEVVGGM